MAFKCTGFEKPPTPSQLHPDVVKKECDGERTSCFLWEYDLNGDNLTFKTRMLVRNDLTKKELPDVLEHERQHWRDFNRRAVALKDAVEQAIKAGRDPALVERLDWMKYDYCTDSAAFHRKIERFPIAVCFKPSSDRPK